MGSANISCVYIGGLGGVPPVKIGPSTLRGQFHISFTYVDANTVSYYVSSQNDNFGKQ